MGWRDFSDGDAEEEGEVPFGESLDDSDTHGCHFPVGSIMLPPSLVSSSLGEKRCPFLDVRRWHF